MKVVAYLAAAIAALSLAGYFIIPELPPGNLARSIAQALSVIALPYVAGVFALVAAGAFVWDRVRRSRALKP